MVLPMEPILHGLRYKEKPSLQLGWERRNMGWDYTSLLTCPGKVQIWCVVTEVRRLFVSVRHFLPLFLALSTQMQREGSTITGQEKELTPCRPFLHLHLSVFFIYLVWAVLFPVQHQPSWMAKQEPRNREGEQTRAGRQQCAGSPGTKRHHTLAGAMLQTHS